MNEENKQKLLNSKKQLTGAVFSFLAVLLLIGTGVAASINNKTEIPTTPATTTETPNQQVAKKVTDEKDVRTTEVKTTEISSEEQTTENKAPVNYTLPLGTAMGRDYDNETPVYNEILGDYRTHGGIDFNGAYGDSVKCCADGTVENVYEDTIWGTVAVIKHSGNVTSKYCGLQSQTIKVQPGDEVKLGECIGYLGEIPCEKNENQAHLHFEMSVNGATCDPIELIGKTNDSE